MTLEIIVFIAAILLGILLYWRESRNNSLYRFFNKLANAKKLQMKPDDRKGFLHQQSFIARLVYILLFFLLIYGGVSVLTPLNIFSFQLFTASVVGMLIGTYIASAIVFANKKIDDNKGTFDEKFEKGKEMVSDIFSDKKEETPEEDVEKKPAPEKEEKSARERLKDQGLL